MLLDSLADSLALSGVRSGQVRSSANTVFQEALLFQNFSLERYPRCRPHQRQVPWGTQGHVSRWEESGDLEERDTLLGEKEGTGDLGDRDTSLGEKGGTRELGDRDTFLDEKEGTGTWETETRLLVKRKGRGTWKTGTRLVVKKEGRGTFIF